jgi:NitT/TauT family transport system permease protein
MTAASPALDNRRFSLRRPAVPWKYVRIAIFYVSLLLLWQLIYELKMWPHYILPGPKDVWDSLKLYIDNGKLKIAIETTMKRMLIGYTLSIFVGFAIGISMGSMKWVDETVGTVVLGLQSLPSVTWFPLALLWFGLNEHAIIFVVLMGSVGSIAISARAGIRAIPPLLTRAARMFGGHRWQMYVLVVIPGMLPSMIQGFKLGWSFAWRSLLAAELLYVSASLGYFLDVGRNLNDVSLIIAIMFVIVTIGIIVDRLIFARLESFVNERWGLAN